MPGQQQRPAQSQSHQPGREYKMRPQPDYEPKYPGVGKLNDKVALITGGDSGIGRAVAVGMAREGAKIAIVYLDEDKDADDTLSAIAKEGSEGIKLRGDVGKEEFCYECVDRVMDRFGRLDILVNNAGEQHEADNPLDISAAQLQHTFQTNIFAMFYMVKAALPHLKHGASILNTTSVTAYKGSPELLDYSASKGAIVAFTRSLSKALEDKGIRVNAVAPGPIWTPLIPASYSAEETAKHGSNAPMGRAGQSNEVAPYYVLLASDDGSYMSGQVLHPNGGTVVSS